MVLDYFEDVCAPKAAQRFRVRVFLANLRDF